MPKDSLAVTSDYFRQLWGRGRSGSGEQPQRPSFDDYFLGMAYAASVRGECSRRQVGAVVIKDGRFRGAGYNGAPSGRPSCLEGACPRASSGVAPNSSYDSGAGSCIAAHAEANAIVDAGRDVCRGGILYITDEPCPGCRTLIAISGIVEVVWPSDLHGVPWRWLPQVVEVR